MLKDYLSFDDRLASDARIVHDPQFRSGVVKIPEGREPVLNIIKKEEVLGLLTSKEEMGADKENISSIVERAETRFRGSEASKLSAYIDIRFISSTFNRCKRFFSIAGLAMTNRRKQMLPVIFESQLFLYKNQ